MKMDLNPKFHFYYNDLLAPRTVGLFQLGDLCVVNDGKVGRGNIYIYIYIYLKTMSCWCLIPN
jgi:hypothetical protein